MNEPMKNSPPRRIEEAGSRGEGRGQKRLSGDPLHQAGHLTIGAFTTAFVAAFFAGALCFLWPLRR